MVHNLRGRKTPAAAASSSDLLARHRLSDFARLSDGFFWEVDRSFVITFISGKLQEILGFSPKEFLGRPLADLAAPGDTVLPKLTAARRFSAFQELTVLLLDVRSAPCPLVMSAVPITGRAYRRPLGLRGYARRAAKDPEPELSLTDRAAQDGTQQSERVRQTSFVASLSHELRTPLHAIIGFSELLSDAVHGPLGDPRYGEYCEDLRGNAHRLLATIDDILILARLSQGDFALSEDDFALAPLVGRILEDLTARTAAKSITLEAALGCEETLVFADRQALGRVLYNLLANAVKFTPPGGRVRLFLEEEADGTLVLTISDTGIGMAPEQIAAALAPFAQVDSSLSRRFGGAGLGLTLAQKLIQAHGGKLAIDSSLGKGTRVSLSLPAWRHEKHSTRQKLGAL